MKSSTGPYGKLWGVLAGSLLTLWGSPGTALADQTNNASLEGIVVGTYQAASRSHVDGQDVHNEANGELYLMGTLDMGPGTWHMEVRGSTTPRDNGVTTFYGSNALVGETLNSSGDGRISATQLFYELPLGAGDFRVGLLDPTSLLDGNDIANDEYTQFMADAFVNNPAISFPSFVLGGAYVGQATKHIGYQLFVGSDSGLEDDDDPSYSNVFEVTGHRDGYDKGAFTAGELDWQAGGYSLQGGAWYDTGRVAAVGMDNGGERGYGVYGLAGAQLGAGRIEGRAAIANKDAQAAANFLSLAYQRPFQLSGHDTTLGVAISRTGDSSRLAYRSDPIYQAEVYWRIHAFGPLYVSPDLQYIDNADFEADNDGVVIGGARVSMAF